MGVIRIKQSLSEQLLVGQPLPRPLLIRAGTAGLVGTSASGQTLDLVKKMDPSAKLLGSEAQDIAHQEKLRLSNILRRHKEGKRVRNLAAEAPQLLPKSRAHARRAPALDPVDSC